MLHSQYGINSSSKIKLRTITKLLLDATIKEAEEKLWQQWLIEFGRMDNTNFVSFEKYKTDAFKTVENIKVEKPSTEEILKDAEEVIRLVESKY